MKYVPGTSDRQAIVVACDAVEVLALYSDEPSCALYEGVMCLSVFQLGVGTYI